VNRRQLEVIAYLQEENRILKQRLGVRCLDLPFNDEYFGVPPSAPHGQKPKLGILHAALVRRAAAAWRAGQ